MKSGFMSTAEIFLSWSCRNVDFCSKIDDKVWEIEK